jgi:hypothetical protein
VPIYQTVAYAFDDTQHGADLFDLKVAGNIPGLNWSSQHCFARPSVSVR